jgi:hypothetical protein
MQSGELGPNEFVAAGQKVDELYDARTARAHAVVVDDGADIYHFDPANRTVQSRMERSIDGARVLVESASLDGNQMLIRAYYPIKPTEWYLYDREAKRLEIIGRN